MPSVCFYFQVHQPFRLKKFSYFDRGEQEGYFDDHKNGEIFKKVARKCYLPTNALLLNLIKRYEGKFKVAFSITGVALEQMRLYSPETLDSFLHLAESGGVEFISETFHHSLAAIYAPGEFKEQVGLHQDLMKSVFGVTPTIFRNTELIYQDFIGHLVSEMGYKAMIAEGVDDILGWRSPNFIYNVPGDPLKLLLKNYRLSDDVAFRFSNRGWEEFPLTADKFSHWVHRVSGNGETVNLFMDYETFGEHQWESTGIFDFLEHLPEAILKHSDWGFKTPSEVVDSYPVRSDLHFHRLTSWADVDRDLTAWNGNHMQRDALKSAFELGEMVKWTGDPELLETWRRLLTSDHFYYMCTKWFADGDVHAYFSPYESPYEAFINYMNVFKDFRRRVTERCASSQGKQLSA